MQSWQQNNLTISVFDIITYIAGPLDYLPHKINDAVLYYSNLACSLLNLTVFI